MPGLEIRPLSDVRDEAARLLAARFARQRAAEPLLPDVSDFDDRVAGLDGVAATRGGETVAYLAGELDGDTARVGFAGCAASEPEALRDLFAVLADQWDVSRFAVAVPASDEEMIDVFFRLAFGLQFFWAVRETDGESPVPVQGRVTAIRESTVDDLEAVAGFDELLWIHQTRSPSFSGLDVRSPDEFREEWSTLWEEDEFPLHVVAEEDGRVVGHALLFSRPDGDLRVPADNIDLAHVAVLEDARGTGVGLALTAHVIAWAREHGYRSMTTDWRSVNLLSSRFWPRRGFRPQYLRLYRAVP